MATLRWFAVVLCCTALGYAGELTTLDGKKMTGDIVAISGEELTFKTPTATEKYLVTTINNITVGPAPKAPAPGLKYALVELTDGSTFRCESFTVDGKEVELKLLAGRTLRVPLTTLFAALKDAGNAKIEQDFRAIVKSRGKFDMFVFRKKDETGKDFLDAFSGTFGEGDKAADAIKFTQEGKADATDVKMTRVEGMVFNQISPAKIAPTLCRVVDTDGNSFAAQAVTRTTKGYTLKTVTDVSVDLEENLVSKFDFAAGSVKYLSDLEPATVLEEGSDPHPYQKDRNLDRQTIELVLDPTTGKREKYAKGLTIHAKTTLTYNVQNQYKTFACIAGVDADKENAADSKVKLTIDDGTKVLWTGVIKKGDKPVDLSLGIQNATQIRIIVESDGPGLDLGNHISLANARVLK